MSSSIVVPNILKYNVVRQDVVVIDHVSLMLSNASRSLIQRVLDESNTLPPLSIKSNLSVTVAYSRACINSSPFKYWDLDNNTQENRLFQEIPYSLNDLLLTTIVDKFNVRSTVLLFKDNSVFFNYHQEYLDKGATWEEGEYIPYIILERYSTLPEDFTSIELNSSNLIAFDAIRFMRFGEVIQPIN